MHLPENDKRTQEEEARGGGQRKEEGKQNTEITQPSSYHLFLSLSHKKEKIKIK